MLAGPTTDRPSRARPVADAPVAALVAAAEGAIGALGRGLWEAALTELPRAPGTLVADLADRLAATSATVVAATLSPRSAAPAPPPTGEPATSPPGSPAPGASAPDLAGE